MELTQLHHKQFKWTSQHDQCFKAMIQAITKFTSLTLPDSSKPFYVQTDASDLSGAGRVFQKDDAGNELLLACVSRTFTRAEQKYGVFRKETLALLYCLKSMDFYLRFANKVIILIDAKAIIYLRMCKDSAGILLRFSLEISKYDAEIHHVQGITNEVSDALSRNNINIKEIIEDKKEANILSEKETEHILKRLTIPDGREFTSDEVRWLLEADSIQSPFFKKKPPSKAKLGKRFIKNNPKTLGERKIKLPKETRWRTSGVVLPTLKTSVIKKQLKTISYEDFTHATQLILSKNITPAILIKAQQDDPSIGHIFRRTIKPKPFKIIDNILFKKLKTGYKLCLPSAFLDAIINTKHFSVFGLHFSKTRIMRDILTKFCVDVQVLKDKLDIISKTCLLCQFNTTSIKPHFLQKTNFIYAPRVSWACDIIPSLPQSNSGNTAIFLAIDMFTGYIQLQPLKSRQTEHLIEALLNSIIRPFGSPKFIRCDSESGMFSSKEFYKFLAPLSIDFLPCSIGAPWSNGAAERAVQTVKTGLRKFIQQEKSFLDWDTYLHYFTSAHNSSCSTYGFTPEELHFGFSNPSFQELFQVWPDTSDHTDYVNKIIPIAEEKRRKSKEIQQQNAKRQLTYRNKTRVDKKFQLGQIVKQKQLQLATGPGKALQTRSTGPYVITSIDEDRSSCVIEHLHTKHQSNAHFSNIELVSYDPSSNRTSTNTEDQLTKFLPEKWSKKKFTDQSGDPLDENDLELDKAEEELRQQETIQEQIVEQTPNTQNEPTTSSNESLQHPHQITATNSSNDDLANLRNFLHGPPQITPSNLEHHDSADSSIKNVESTTQNLSIKQTPISSPSTEVQDEAYSDQDLNETTKTFKTLAPPISSPSTEVQDEIYSDQDMNETTKTFQPLNETTKTFKTPEPPIETPKLINTQLKSRVKKPPDLPATFEPRQTRSMTKKLRFASQATFIEDKPLYSKTFLVFIRTANNITLNCGLLMKMIKQIFSNEENVFHIKRISCFA